MKKYSTIRLLLSIALGFLMSIVVLSLFSKTSSANFLPITLVLIGSVLFTLNRRCADYISFSIFIFGFVVSITYKIDHCLKSESCWESIYTSLANDKIELTYIFLSSLVLTFLIFSFYRNKNIK